MLIYVNFLLWNKNILGIFVQKILMVGQKRAHGSGSVPTEESKGWGE